MKATKARKADARSCLMVIFRCIISFVFFAGKSTFPLAEGLSNTSQSLAILYKAFFFFTFV